MKIIDNDLNGLSEKLMSYLEPLRDMIGESAENDSLGSSERAKYDFIFLDIETTGLSREKAQVYLIGVGFAEAAAPKKSGSPDDTGKNNASYNEASNETVFFNTASPHSVSPEYTPTYAIKWCTRFFFAESPNEEGDILKAFFDFLSGRQNPILITFNGRKFDLPFLKRRCEICLSSVFPYTFPPDIDLYHCLRPFKKILRLNHLKQTSIENFLSIKREDKHTGKELISLYYEFVKTREMALFDAILLHNYSDIAGMGKLLSILSYILLFDPRVRYEPINIEKKAYPGLKGDIKEEIFINFRLREPVPVEKLFIKEPFYLSVKGDKGVLRVPIINGEMKHFYPDYENYYYLPDEDMAIHKSVGAFVDKKLRVKAKPDTCYTRVRGSFLPQLSEWFQPVLKQGRKQPLPEALQKGNALSASLSSGNDRRMTDALLPHSDDRRMTDALPPHSDDRRMTTEDENALFLQLNEKRAGNRAFWRDYLNLCLHNLVM